MAFHAVRDWFRNFLPAPVTAGRLEQMRAAVGALVGLLLTGVITRHAVGDGVALPMLIAPMGASAVLLFAVPSSPLAQPWSIMGGNLLAAVIGVTCARWIADPLLAAPLAGALAIASGFALRCLHPPSGAVALTVVLGGPAVAAAGYHFVLMPVMLNSAILAVTAIIYNNATRRTYPHPQQHRANMHHTRDMTPLERMGLSPADLDEVLRNYDQVLDVPFDDLESLFQRAETLAYRRRFGRITCSDVMSRDVMAVQFGTPLQEAWPLLRGHDIRALPVIDPARRVIGMVSDLDFLNAAKLDVYHGLAARFRRFIQSPDTPYTDRPEVVGQIMHSRISTVEETAHITELVPLMADAGMRHVAVVDAERRLAGIISQADLVAALYRGGVAAADGAASA